MSPVTMKSNPVGKDLSVVGLLYIHWISGEDFIGHKSDNPKNTSDLHLFDVREKNIEIHVVYLSHKIFFYLVLFKTLNMHMIIF